MKICLFNAKYSPNLGDGLLTECLENALREQTAGQMGVVSIDAAARTSYKPGKSSRGAALQILHALPEQIRHAILALPLRAALRRVWLPHYERSLVGSSALVIGGGNLFTDMDLNFPSKISGALRLARTLNLPVCIYGVGVSSDWSAKGLQLMSQALSGTDVRYVSVRDEASRYNFDKTFYKMTKHHARIVRDPGLLVSRYVKRVGTPSRQIGVNIMSAIAVRYHSNIAVGDDFLIQWYSQLIKSLKTLAYEVSLFTNGSPEDVIFAEKIVARAGIDLGNGKHMLRPADPSELALFVSDCALVIAFRLHALIAAHSYGSRLVALKWDPKVESFMNSISDPNIFSTIEMSPGEMSIKVDMIYRNINIPHQGDHVVSSAYNDISSLVEVLQAL